MKITTAEKLLNNTKEVLEGFNFDTDIEKIKDAIKEALKNKEITYSQKLIVVQLNGCDYLDTTDEDWEGVHVQFFEDGRYFQATDGITFGLSDAVFDCNWGEGDEWGYGIAILTEKQFENSERAEDHKKMCALEGMTLREVREILTHKEFYIYVKRYNIYKNCSEYFDIDDDEELERLAELEGKNKEELLEKLEDCKVVEIEPSGPNMVKVFVELE